MAYDLVARLRLVDNLTNPLKQATAGISGIGTAAVGAAAAIGGIAAAVGAVGVAKSSIDKAMNFESQLDSIAALDSSLAKGGEGYAKMQKLALDMGAKTKYSALESAKGMEELVKAGLSVNQVMNGGLEAALNLASAGDLQLAESAEIMSTAMNAFKRDGISAAQAADILAGTANASATDVHDLKYSLAAVSAVAAGVGLSFRDTNSALGLFANNGFKGSDAGTSLKTMLNSLQPRTKGQILLFEKLGLVTADGANKFYTAEGKIQSMESIAGSLHTALAGLTDQQRQMALETMFGSDAIRAGNILYNEGAAGVAKFNAEMAKTTALNVAKAKMDNAKGAVEQFKGAMETLQIAALMPTMPLIKQVALAAADMAGNFTVWLTSPQAKAWGDTIKGVLGTVGSVFGGMVAMFQANSLDAWFSSFNGLQNIVGAPVANMLATVVGAFQSASQQIAGFFALFQAGSLDQYMAAFQNLGNIVGQDTANNIAGAVSFIKQAIADLGAKGQEFLPILMSGFQQFGNYMSQLWTLIQPIFPSLWAGIMNVVTVFMQFLPAIQSIGGALMGLVITVVGAFMSQWPLISSTFANVWNFLQPVFAMLGAAFNGIKVALGVVGDVFAYIWPQIVAIAAPALESIARLAGNLGKVVMFLINNIVIPLLPVLGTIIKGLWDFIAPIISLIVGAITGIANAISWVIEKAGAMAKAFDGMKDVKIGLPQWMGGNGVIQHTGAPQPNSKASGISNVPYDGYLARLHKGERVLTPEENSNTRDGSPVGGHSFTFGDIHINGASNNVEQMADQLMAVIARRVHEVGGQM